MKDMTIDMPMRLNDYVAEEDRPEPFASIYELMEDYTKLEVLEALQLLCELDSEATESFPECRNQESWLAIELESLLARYAGRFSPIDRINHPGRGCGAILLFLFKVYSVGIQSHGI
jgi:hypothetical protein